VDHALTATCVISMVVFVVRQMLLLGRACRRLVAALLRHLPAGIRVLVRLNGAELQILVIWPQARLRRSETNA
jgi:hypothetical protein